MWPTKTMHVHLGTSDYQLKYPYSPAMQTELTRIFAGEEYPLGLPADYEPRTIVDIGANVGAAALWFHHKYPAAQIHCYEPSPSVYEFLAENTAPYSNIVTHHVGLFDRDERRQLYLGQFHAAQSSIVQHAETQIQSESIALQRASTALTKLNLSRISILKLDTEGCEVPILRNLNDWLPRIDVIYLEYHSEADRRTIDQLLGDNFYLLYCAVQRTHLGRMVFVAHPFAAQVDNWISQEIRLTE